MTAGDPRLRSARERRFAPIAALLGLVGFVISAAGSWQPSLWGDEAASIMSAERPLPSLFRMLGHVDAVHGGYYLFLHAWIRVFGSSESAVRLPSAIAIGAAAAGTAVLARNLFDARVAVIAALAFAVLPRVTYMGAEARSTALASAVAVWLSVLLVQALRVDGKPTRHPLALWTGYAVLWAAGLYLFLYLALLIPVHALAVLLLGRTQTRSIPALGRWAVATGAGLALAAPILYWGVSQRHQVDFLGRRPPPTLDDVAVLQWFGNAAVASAAWALILFAVVTAYRGWRRREAGTAAFPGALATMLAWLIIPTAVLVLGTYLGAPLYSRRYLSFCAPAAAIALAAGLAAMRWRRSHAAGVLLIAVLAVPTYLAQRGDFGKNGGSDWRQAAAVLQEEAAPGDAVVFDESVRPSRRPRVAMHVYPDAFQGLRDITLAQSYLTAADLWDRTVPLGAALGALDASDTVWLLQNRGSRTSTRGSDVRTLREHGFTVAEVTIVHRTLIIEMTR